MSNQICTRCRSAIDEFSVQTNQVLCWECRTADAEIAAENAWLVYAERPDFEDESYRSI